MSVILKAIKFNHDPTSADHDALNIRRNKTQFISVPEWVHGMSTTAEDSLAAYTKNETRGKTITIQAQFQAYDIEQAEIRAIDPTKDESDPGGCSGWLIKLLRLIFRAIFGNVLGEVKEKMVRFGSDGDSGFVTFELKDLRLWDVGVGIHYTTWQWQYRLSGSNKWIDIETTRHKIYVLLEIPRSPWQQTPYDATNDQLPWTEVLNYACEWAIGATNRDAAATKITERVNGLGPSLFEYSPVGNHAYAIPAVFYPTEFNCTEYLERLAGGPGLGKYINCTDCATIVSTFANILGCDLWQSRMQERESTRDSAGFECNEIISIGNAAWAVPFTWGFRYHEVAWKGSCDINDELFDACLKVDGDSDPTGSAPHTQLLTTNLKFGNPGDLLYRDRLAAPAGRANCKPFQSTKTRRRIV